MKLRIYIIVSAALLLAHCAGTQQNTIIDDGQSSDSSEREKWDEDFDPLSLNDYRLDVEPRKSDFDDVVTVEQLLRGNSVQDTVAVGRETQGFRVQLISTRDQEEARSVLRNAAISFSENAYRDYSNPYYKVRVGDFKSRYNASLFQEKAIEMGFHEAWVVRSIIWDGPPKIAPDVEKN